MKSFPYAKTRFLACLHEVRRRIDLLLYYKVNSWAYGRRSVRFSCVISLIVLCEEILEPCRAFGSLWTFCVRVWYRSGQCHFKIQWEIWKVTYIVLPYKCVSEIHALYGITKPMSKPS